MQLPCILLVLVGFLFFAFLALQPVTCQLGSCNPHNASPSLERFVDPLPIPISINVSAGIPITLGAFKITQKLHRDLPNSTLYAYGTSEATATYPGPTLEAIRGIEAHVNWENHIPDLEHMFAVDKTLHWANPRHGGVPIVTHLHGGEVESSSDGHPDAWFTRFGEPGPSYKSQNYTYANSQVPAMLWYHDHVVGITRLNVFAGLLGAYFIRSNSCDQEEETLKLPTGAYEIPLIFQDKQFYANGTLEFPVSGDDPSAHPSWCPEFFGDVLLVNGKVWPYLNVEPRLYRFRMLNGANSRFFTLFFSPMNLSFVQIGTDGGLLPNKPRILNNITFAPAERLDVLIDFSGLKPGTELFLNNSAIVPFPVGIPRFPGLNENPGTRVAMKFVVVSGNYSSAAAAAASASIPKSLPGRLQKIDHSHALVRNLTLLQIDDANGLTIQTLLANMSWEQPATETPKEGSVEVWRIINLTPKSHAIHVHLIQFRVLDQRGFNTTNYEAGNCSLDVPYPHKRSCYTESKRKPDANQQGWKDTVALSPGNVTRLLLRFTTRSGQPFPFDATAEPGYLWHCHMLDHEDNDMMRPLKMLKSSSIG